MTNCHRVKAIREKENICKWECWDVVSKKLQAKFGTYNKLGSWLLCRGARGWSGRSEISPRQVWTLPNSSHFQICSSKLLPLKVITSSKQINLNIPLVLEGVRCRALNAPGEGWARLSGAGFLSSVLLGDVCSSWMFKQDNFHAIS